MSDEIIHPTADEVLAIHEAVVASDLGQPKNRYPYAPNRC
jgi:hypothetical protein